MDLSHCLAETIATVFSYVLSTDAQPIFVIVAIGLLFAYYIYRSDTSQLPVEFESFVGTSFPEVIEQKTLRCSEFEAAIQVEHPNQLPDVVSQLCAVNSFAAAVRKSVESSERPNVMISGSAPTISIKLQRLPQKRDSVFTEGSNKGKAALWPHIDTLTVGGLEPSAVSLISIHGARIRKVVIDDSVQGFLSFQDCWIAFLQIKARESSSPIQLHLKNSYVGNLDMGVNCCAAFSMHKGGIQAVQCPSYPNPSPVLNFFKIDASVVLAPKDIHENGIAGFRDLLVHIRHRSSSFTQQVISAAIFRLERKGDPWFLRVVNFCYRIFSAYNTKPGRPLGWTLLSIGICSYLAFAFDLSVVSKTCDASIVGHASWVTQLCEEGMLGRASRSVVLTLSAFINPFGLFSDAAPVLARTMWFNVFLIVAALLNFVWVALTAFSIKTRFSAKATGS